MWKKASKAFLNLDVQKHHLVYSSFRISAWFWKGLCASVVRTNRYRRSISISSLCRLSRKYYQSAEDIPHNYGQASISPILLICYLMTIDKRMRWLNYRMLNYISGSKILRFIIDKIKYRYWERSWACFMHLQSSWHISITSIVILSYYLFPALSSSLFARYFRIKIADVFIFSSRPSNIYNSS